MTARLPPVRPVAHPETAAEVQWRLRQGTGTLWTECEVMRPGCADLAAVVVPDRGWGGWRPACRPCADALATQGEPDDH